MDIEKIKQQLKMDAPIFTKQVAPLYRQLGWTWGGGNEEHIPGEKEILKTVRDLIDEIYPDFMVLGCGGLEVYHDKKNGEYGIRFVYDITHFYKV